MSQSFRQLEILEIARRDGKVGVDDLAARFGVTLQTIRRDLSELSEAGQLDRVHGGAVLPSGTINIAHAERRTLNASAKAAMARACAGMIPDDCALFIGLGTTAEALARQILHHRNLLVVTNNTHVAGILSANSDCTVVLTGGTLRRSDGGLLGLHAAHTARQFRFDMALMGCSALDPSGDLMDFDMSEVGLAQVILRQARRRVLLADGSKLTRNAPARIACLYDFDTFVTDAPLPPELAGKCRDWGTEVMIASA
ncbi:DeoR family transcriptional regulator [Salipiger pallidus]|uniref:DeoR family transcriptional regulator n=1 Tax=Salipiger pallidus TaxID=1775170 RepID=A0A8J3EGI6_9RHOB|nr:DeoR/GlpR family DNA-binding transcription regulator [Salipiger pallidus]GGG71072.1 DeoR family transcriptional regulator [Salipiger pallidus]